MWRTIIQTAIFVLCNVLFAQALDISPKTSFISSESSSIHKSPVDVFHPTQEKDKLASYKRTVIIKEGDDDSQENVVCKEDKCIVTVDANISSKKPKTKTVSTDVHVIVSSDVDVEKGSGKNPEKKDENDGDVPVFKGYNGVKFEDVNWNEFDKPKPKSEEPSSVITSPYNGEEIIINPGNTPHKPIDHMLPPKSDWNSNREYHNYDENRGVRIPSGWSSNWKPSYPPPGDYYHYNVHGDKKDFSGHVPTYRNVCKCTREPIYPRRSDFYPNRPVNPWYPVETTTKQFVDDKLSPPFSVKQKRNYD